MSKATEDDLASLHGVVADALTQVISNGVNVIVGKGEEAAVVNQPAPAAYFAAAITLLKNNNITAAKGNAELDQLKQALENKRKARPPVLTPQALDEAAALFGNQLQ